MESKIQKARNPLVSILMTSYNREKFIAEAIQSVTKSIFEDWELIVCDDCSSDQTVNIAKQAAAGDPRIRIFVNENNLGQFQNRNRIATYAKGKYLKYLDSDDLMYKDSLGIMVQLMEQYPQAGLGLSISAKSTSMLMPGLYDSNTILLNHYLRSGCLLIAPSAIIICANAFRSVGGFASYGMPTDNHMTLKIASRYPVVAMPDDLVFWRRHENQAFNERFLLENIFNNYNLNMDILQSKHCPLNSKDKKHIIFNQKKILLINIFLRFINAPFQINKLLTLMKTNRINLSLISDLIFYKLNLKS